MIETSFVKRREVPMAVLSLTILIMVGSYYFNVGVFQTLGKYVREFVVVMTAILLGVGFVNVLMRDITRIIKKEPGQWYLSLIMIVSVFIMFFVCAGNRLMPKSFSGIYNFVYSGVYARFTTAVMALAGFFIFTAVYRGMRLKTLESGAFTVAHVFAVLTNAPIGAIIWAGIPVIGTWINETIMSAGLRGFIICTSLGAVILGFRYIIGKSVTIVGGE